MIENISFLIHLWWSCLCFKEERVHVWRRSLTVAIYLYQYLKGIDMRLPLQRQRQDGIHQSFAPFTMSSFDSSRLCTVTYIKSSCTQFSQVWLVLLRWLCLVVASRKEMAQTTLGCQRQKRYRAERVFILFPITLVVTQRSWAEWKGQTVVSSHCNLPPFHSAQHDTNFSTQLVFSSRSGGGISSYFIMFF